MAYKTPSDSHDRIITTTCSYDCGGRCLLKVHVSDNTIQRISTENRQGLDIKACPRGLAQKAVVEDPHRLMQPMKRTGPRGSGEFVKISWDEALEKVSTELQRVKERYGSESVYYLGGSGSLSTLHSTPNLTKRFFHLFGRCTTKWGGASFEAALQSSLATFGTVFTGNTRENLLSSKLIILWGWNPVVSRFGPDTKPYLSQAKEAGIKIIGVDPRYSRSSKNLCNEWIPIKPATDAAMLIAMAYTMIDEDLYDKDFIAKYTVGFEKFAEYVIGQEDGIPKTPGWAQEITSVPAETITRLAREYATAKPAALITGWAPGRTAFGEQFHRAASTLSTMTGNIGIEGGNAGGGVGFVDLGLIEETVPVPQTPHLEVHNTELYDAILRGKAGGYPSDCKLLYIVGNNPLNQYLNLNKGIQAFQIPECIVVHELFLTPTARFADIVLPAAHFFEREDIGQPAIGGPYNIYMNKILHSPSGPKSDLAIFTELAARLGIEQYNNKSEAEWLETILGAKPGLANLKDEQVYRIELDRPWVAFREQIEHPGDSSFPTPSGKIEIFSQMFAEKKHPLIPAVPTYIPPWEGPQDELSIEYPIQLISPHSPARVNSSFDNIPQLKKLADDTLWLNSEDARKRGIQNGDQVLVFNVRGCLYATATVTDRIMSGVASLDQGMWYAPDNEGVDHGGCVNVLTADEMSPAGAFASNSCLVQIEKVS
ncbi:dimethyl sulfoxide reductase subunit A [candidate division KSB3 bacterium]|uniref:Dimethyl sulfoxide reductase subunit A n=1 Tax=candidate division KSB3 bacterium TaxID=2044937 RepID=A0A2G6KJE3_9BACT|nr:MAG: dimethyl sulfoxide reductase subunit A [candidate division KSB3 bacterium]